MCNQHHGQQNTPPPPLDSREGQMVIAKGTSPRHLGASGFTLRHRLSPDSDHRLSLTLVPAQSLTLSSGFPGPTSLLTSVVPGVVQRPGLRAWTCSPTPSLGWTHSSKSPPYVPTEGGWHCSSPAESPAELLPTRPRKSRVSWVREAGAPPTSGSRCKEHPPALMS